MPTPAFHHSLIRLCHATARGRLRMLASCRFVPALVLLLAPVLTATSHAELTLATVRADKVFYDPGAKARFEVVVTNPDAVEATANLRVELLTDVDARQLLGAVTVTVPAKGQQTWTGSAVLAPVLGMELTATLARDGKPFAERSDYFSCARSVHQVLIFGMANWGAWQFSGLMDGAGETYPKTFAAELRGNYGNCIEKFGWAPSDFDCLTPTTDRWWAGQGAYNECKTNMLAIISALHADGLRVVTYGKEAAGGVVGYERLRRRPDLAPYSNGRPWLENYSAAYLDFMTALGPPHPGERRMVPGTPAEMEKSGYAGAGWFQPYTPGGQNWCSIWYDGSDAEVAGQGIGELARSATMFGFDGVRFDGEFFARRYQRQDGSWNLPEKTDLEPLNVALTRRMKNECWATKRGYLFGYNTGTDITWSIPLDNTPAAFREKCKDDGLIANEAMAFPGDVPWSQYCRAVRREAEIVRFYGGHHATYAFNRSGDHLYNYLCQYALRSHQMVPFRGPGQEWLNRSATRFSRLLWDSSLTTWREAEKQLTVTTGGRQVWWQEFAAVGDAPQGGTRYVIHLINPPESPTTFGKAQLPAGPATSVSVRWAGLPKVRAAWIVDMAKTTAVAVTPEDGVFAAGDVAYWKILVVDVDTPKPAATWEAAAAGKSALPSAADLQIAPAPAVSGDSWRSVVEPERWGGGEDVAERLPDPGASAGGAVMGKAGGKTGPMAYSYEYPRIPGRYRCTYRLKVADNTVDKPVFQLTTGLSSAPPFPGLGRLYAESKVLKGTDFAKPNVYQSFTAELDYADYGFMGCGVNFLGGAQGWWDSLTVDLIRPWTDAELAEYYKSFTRPEGLARTPRAAPQVLVVRGLFNREYRIDDAIRTRPDAHQFDAYTSYGQQQGTLLTGYKWDWKPLWDLDVIVLADVETKGLNSGQVLMLSEWVKDGGGLLILGGPLTLGQDDNMKRAWPRLLPVELNGPWEVRKCEPPVKLAGSGADAAVVLYRHLVKPKAGATVLLQGAGGEPLLVGQSYGAGRVAVFTGTVLGDAPAGSKAFWETAAWPQRLGDAIAWVAGK